MNLWGCQTENQFLLKTKEKSEVKIHRVENAFPLNLPMLL